MRTEVAEEFQAYPAHVTEPVDNSSFASPQELIRQSDFFADAFMTRHLLDAMPGMVLVLNCFRQIIFANRAFCQLSGRPDTESLAGEESVQECMLACQDGDVRQNLTLRVWSAPLGYGDEAFTVLPEGPR